MAKFSLQVSPQRLLIQLKSEEWNGEWLDVSSSDEIGDKAVIKAVILEVLKFINKGVNNGD